MLPIQSNLQRSLPFSSPLAGELHSRAAAPLPASDAPAVHTAAEPLNQVSEFAARPAPTGQESGDWLSDAVNGAKAALEQMSKEIGLLSDVAYRQGQNGLGAINRAWSKSLGETAKRLNAFGLGMSLAEDVGDHGVVEGALRTGVKEIGSDVGVALGVLASPSVPLKIAGAAVGAVVGENLTDRALDEVSAGYWGADDLYAATLAEGGDLNEAARANLARHQGWLHDPSLSPLERAGQFMVDGLQTFGGDIAVLWDGASDWLGGDELAASPAPSFDGPAFEWSEPVPIGGWSDFNDGAYEWSDFNDGAYGWSDFNDGAYEWSDFNDFSSDAVSSAPAF